MGVSDLMPRLEAHSLTEKPRKGVTYRWARREMAKDRYRAAKRAVKNGRK